jgi:hypothetical protein
MTKQLAILCCLTGLFFFHFPPVVFAQTNSWTNSVSGNWEDPYWSLGELPSANQDVLLTNAGWKALEIGPNTVQNFPQTMKVDSITISSPPGSFNTLLLNYTGTQTPLTANSILIADSSRLTMLSSALQLTGSNIVALQVGGEFDQTDSLVSAQQISVGYIGRGTYNLNSGTLAASGLSVEGTFNQNGGTNNADTGIWGEYFLNDGRFDGPIYVDGTFWQRGGLHNGNIAGGGHVIQTGGTNSGDLQFIYNGYSDIYYVGGSYTISNGFYSGGITIDGTGSFVQNGGTITGSNVSVRSIPVYLKGGGGYLMEASFIQSGGTMTCSAMDIEGLYRQYSGSNFVAGTLAVSGLASVSTSGWFCASNLAIQVLSVGLTPHFGGTVIISNDLSVLSYDGGGYSGSGNLTASNITLKGCSFSFAEGTINQSGVLTISNADLSFCGPGTFNLGRLQLNANSTLSLSNVCVLHFSRSDSMTWTNALLTVKQWSGSLYGGGAHRILFGANATALNPQQLSQIQFQNPAGLPPGNYPARILATGEIVPDTGGPLPVNMSITRASTNSSMQLKLCGDIGRNYDIEVSADLVNWTWWTNQFNSNGTISIPDCEATNYSQRFYRARLAP